MYSRVNQFFLVTIFFTSVIPLHGEVLRLSLQKAVNLAITEQGNKEVQVLDEISKEAEARRKIARSVLLPQLDGYTRLQGQTVNLEAFGLQPNPIFGFPTLVGPFTTFDIRGEVRQNIFHMGAIRQYQSASVHAESSELGNRRAVDQVTASVARSYLDVLRAQATLESAESGILLAEALLQLAKNNQEAGTATRLEVTRAEVQLRHEKQRRLSALTLKRNLGLRLLRTLGLPLDTDLELISEMTDFPAKPVTLDEAVSLAIQSRPDLAMQRKKETGARLSYESSKFERIPVLAGFANYGSIGIHPGSKIPTWTAGLQLQIPLFDGGAIDAKRAEKAAQLRQSEIRSSDLLEQVRLEVRLAHEAVELASQEIEVADEGLELAREEIAHSRRRYESGLTTNLEVTDAQNSLKRAEENQVSALYKFYTAQIDLLEAMGTIQETKLP